MLCQIFTKSNYFSRINLFYCENKAILLNNTFSTGNKFNLRNLKRNGVKNKEFKKNGHKNSKNENNQTITKEYHIRLGNPKLPSFSDFMVAISGFTVIYGLLKMRSVYKRVSDLRSVSYKEFEENYLMHGEVKSVTILGPLIAYFTGCAAEVNLHLDQNRQFQSISIEQVTNSDYQQIERSIREKEYTLHVPRKETIRIGIIAPESYIFLAVSYILFHIVQRKKVQFRQSMTIEKLTKTKPYSRDSTKSSPFNEKAQKDINNVETAKKEMEKTFKNIFNADIFNVKPDEIVEKSSIKFKDVAGLHSAKVEVKEFLDYLNNPSKFIRLGAKLPRGAILLGPPGCGKTLLVKALANESNVPFYYKSGPDFVDVIGGMGAKKMRSLFATARENAPSIIFIDEIDAIGRQRTDKHTDVGGPEQTLNQLLVEMDGMDSILGVVVFAATNRADVLDVALVRPGRFDRHILIDLPVLEERKEIFNLYLNKYQNKLESSVNDLKEKLALQTPGMSGADISNVCNEAALTAAKLNYEIIKDECFDMALERIIAGAAKKTNVLNEKERKIVAYHEAGHTLVAWLLKYAEPVLKVSIVPRTSAALGFTQPNVSERYLLTNDILADKIAVLLGGRAAESAIFNHVTSGSENDLKEVKKIVYNMIREWGMSEAVGHLSFQISKEDEELGILPFSNHTQSLIESEANKIITTAYRRAESIIQNNLDKLELLAQELLKKEVLGFKDIEILIGPKVK